MAKKSANERGTRTPLAERGATHPNFAEPNVRFNPHNVKKKTKKH